MSKFYTSMGGYVAPPNDVEAEVEVGFFKLWLTRNTLQHNGVEGKRVYIHHQSLALAAALFETPDVYDRKWASVENFKRDADAAFLRKIKPFTRSAKND